MVDMKFLKETCWYRLCWSIKKRLEGTSFPCLRMVWSKDGLGLCCVITSVILYLLSIGIWSWSNLRLSITAALHNLRNACSSWVHKGFLKCLIINARSTWNTLGCLCSYLSSCGATNIPVEILHFSSSSERMKKNPIWECLSGRVWKVLCENTNIWILSKSRGT